MWTGGSRSCTNACEQSMRKSSTVDAHFGATTAGRRLRIVEQHFRHWTGDSRCNDCYRSRLRLSVAWRWYRECHLVWKGWKGSVPPESEMQVGQSVICKSPYKVVLRLGAVENKVVLRPAAVEAATA